MMDANSAWLTYVQWISPAVSLAAAQLSNKPDNRSNERRLIDAVHVHMSPTQLLCSGPAALVMGNRNCQLIPGKLHGCLLEGQTAINTQDA
jgi:hypothetical protein